MGTKLRALGTILRNRETLGTKQQLGTKLIRGGHISDFRETIGHANNFLVVGSMLANRLCRRPVRASIRHLADPDGAEARSVGSCAETPPIRQIGWGNHEHWREHWFSTLLTIRQIGVPAASKTRSESGSAKSVTRTLTDLNTTGGKEKGREGRGSSSRSSSGGERAGLKAFLQLAAAGATPCQALNH